MRSMEIKKIMEDIRAVDEIHLEERAKLLMEIGGFGVGGIELPVISPGARRIDTPQKEKQAALEESIRRLWSDAFLCYMERAFRACVILLATIIEATLRLELEKRQKVYSEMTLGQLISYCRKKNIISKKVASAAYRVNDLRIKALHFKLETEKPTVMGSIPEIDEIVPLNKYENPPVKFHENGSVSGDGVTLVWELGKGYGILYKFKVAAKGSFAEVKYILGSLYGLKFKSGQDWY